MHILTGLDLGTSSVKCIIGRMDDEELITLGAGEEASAGMVTGQITNIGAATEAVISAIDRAERSAGVRAENIIVSVNRSRAQNRHYVHEITLQDEAITDKDMQRLLSEAKAKIHLAPGRKLFQVTPISYSIDDGLETVNAVGLYAKKLAVKLNCISVDEKAIRNVDSVLARAHLSAHHKVFAPYAAGLAVLKPEESELGGIVVDIGAETVGIAIFKNNALIHASSLPFGMNIVRNDIAHGLLSTREDAQRLLLRYGNAMVALQDSNSFFTYKKAGDAETVPLAQLPVSKINEMISFRMREIIQQVVKRLDEAGIQETQIWHVVLTGGGGGLEGLSMLAHDILKGAIRIGMPEGVIGAPQSLKMPQGACLAGLLNYGKQELLYAKHTQTNQRFDAASSPNHFANLWRWFKHYF